MEISIENAGTHVSVRLYGCLDARGAGSIYDAVVGLGSLGPGPVMLDLGQVTSAAQAGTGAIFVAAKMLKTKTGRRHQIRDASQDVAELLAHRGFDHLIDLGVRQSFWRAA
ncbi:MAG: hypothetical protein AAF871_08480 [Pseudomonadota bacterium]